MALATVLALRRLMGGAGYFSYMPVKLYAPALYMFYLTVLLIGLINVRYIELLSSIPMALASYILSKASRAMAFRGSEYADTLSALSTSLALYAASMMLGAAYWPASYPFLMPAIWYMALGALTAVRGIMRGPIALLWDSRGGVGVSLFGLGVLYAILTIPKDPQYNTYILAASLAVVVAIVSYVSYRAYKGGSSSIDSIIDEVYEAHKRSSAMVETPEARYLMDAVEQFVKRGRKEDLVMYLTYIMSARGLEYPEIRNILSEIIDYVDPYVARRRQDIERLIKFRMEVATRVIVKALSGEEVGSGG